MPIFWPSTLGAIRCVLFDIRTKKYTRAPNLHTGQCAAFSSSFYGLASHFKFDHDLRCVEVVTFRDVHFHIVHKCIVQSVDFVYQFCYYLCAAVAAADNTMRTINHRFSEFLTALALGTLPVNGSEER